MTRSTITIRRDVLRSWLTVSDCSRAQMADALSVSRGRISQLLNSDQELSARLIAGLLHLTKLPFDRLFLVKELKHSRRTPRSVRLQVRRRPEDNQPVVQP